MDLSQAIKEISRVLPQFGGRNKIRTVFDVSAFFDKEVLMIITGDAISAFDHVMLTEIPGKGIVLNEVSAWWFRKTAAICKNHFITDDLDNIPGDADCIKQLQLVLGPYKEVLKGRIMLVAKAQPLPAEFIVRRYLLGSAWESYDKTGMVCGIRLPPDLEKGARLDELIFTPSTKAGFGQHDENISFEQLVDLLTERFGSILGRAYAEEIRRKSIGLFIYAEAVAAEKGLTLQDTKYEFALLDGTLILIDELFTPDNSRWTPDYTKEPFRQALRWVGATTVPVTIGTPLVMTTQQNYNKALQLITGQTLTQYGIEV